MCYKIIPNAFLFFLLTGALWAKEPPPGASWHLKSAPHFEIYHESSWSPNSVTLELERLYGKLRLNVSMFAPWMMKEKTRIYIYRNQETYLKGEFTPPKWSKGLAYFSKKTIVVYDTGDTVKLRAVIAHELTHLYFESFYGEHIKYPPQWLNEGLAVMMEDLSYSVDSPWSQGLKFVPKEKIMPLEDFFRLQLEQLDSDAEIGYWYLESFGAVSYLFRPHMRLQFKNFCDLLRKGEPLNSALWKVYRLNGPAGMEAPWRQWLATYGTNENQGFMTDFPSASFNFKPAQFSSFTLSGFGPKSQKSKKSR